MRLRVLPDNPAAGRTLPHSIEAEEYLLSCCLLDGSDVIGRCLGAKLDSRAFYHPANAIVYEKICEIYRRRPPVELAVLAEELKSGGQLEAIGGYAYLTQISARIPTTAQAMYFLEKVKCLWILRELITHGTRLVEECFSYSGQKLPELLSPHVNWFETAMARLSRPLTGDLMTLGKRIQEVRADTALRAENKEDRSGWIYTGLPSFDDLSKSTCLRPFGSSDEDHFILVAAGSSQGKSVLMRNWADQALQNNQRVLVYTLETSVKGFCRALASARAGVNLLHLGSTPRELLKRFDDELGRLEELADRRLFIFQNEDGCELRTIEDITRHARNWAMHHGVPHLIELDYLQMVGTKKNCKSREQEVAHVSHGYQALIRELGMVGAGAVQLNESGLKEMRQVRRDENGKVIHRLPNRGDLRESQALYHDADRVEFIYIPPVDRCDRDQTEAGIERPEAWIVQDKCRNGTRGISMCRFEKPYLRFMPLSHEEVNAGDQHQASQTGKIARGSLVSKEKLLREGY